MSFQEYADEAESRQRLASVNPKVLAGVIAIVVAIAACIAFNLAGANASSEALTITQSAPEEEVPVDSAPAAPETICVHVGGCVARPGVFYLDEGSRVADAVDAAGGMTPEAAANSINLARVVQDGEQILVASAHDLQPQEVAGASSATSVTASGQDAQNGKVNINTANSSELQTITGIGESKAKKIIDYREKNGPFKSIEELTNVSGIGDKTLESIKDAICI